MWIRGELPWIALSLTGAFGLYGLVRKKTPVDAVVGLSVETLLLFPVALVAIVYWAAEGTGAFGGEMRESSLLAFSGVATAVPLIWFAAAATLAADGPRVPAVHRAHDHQLPARHLLVR